MRSATIAPNASFMAYCEQIETRQRRDGALFYANLRAHERTFLLQQDRTIQWGQRGWAASEAAA